MIENRPRRPRRFRFGLRTLFVVTLTVSVLLAALTHGPESAPVLLLIVGLFAVQELLRFADCSGKKPSQSR